MCVYYLQVTVLKFQQNCLRKYAIDIKRSFNFISENPFFTQSRKKQYQKCGKTFLCRAFKFVRTATVSLVRRPLSYFCLTISKAYLFEMFESYLFRSVELYLIKIFESYLFELFDFIFLVWKIFCFKYLGHICSKYLSYFYSEVFE
jgi:hypothetical protein